MYRRCQKTRRVKKSLHIYFEKGSRKKCTRQPRMVLWVVLSSLFFKEIRKNDTRGNGRMFASVKSRLDSYSVRNSVLIISHIISGLLRAQFF